MDEDGNIDIVANLESVDQPPDRPADQDVRPLGPKELVRFDVPQLALHDLTWDHVRHLSVTNWILIGSAIVFVGTAGTCIGSFKTTVFDVHPAHQAEQTASTALRMCEQTRTLAIEQANLKAEQANLKAEQSAAELRNKIELLENELKSCRRTSR